MEKEHNKSKRRRHQKTLLRVLRNPYTRETLIREMMRSPMRKLEQKEETA